MDAMHCLAKHEVQERIAVLGPGCGEGVFVLLHKMVQRRDALELAVRDLREGAATLRAQALGENLGTPETHSPLVLEARRVLEETRGAEAGE